MASDIEFNDLIIDWDFDLRNIGILNHLHQRGFYKRLCLNPIPLRDQLAASPWLVILYVEQNVNLPGLMELSFKSGLTKLRKEDGIIVIDGNTGLVNLIRLIICEICC